MKKTSTLARRPRKPRSAAARTAARSLAWAAGAWTAKSDVRDRIRLHHPDIARYAAAGAALDGCLMRLSGVRDYRVSPVTSTVLVKYDGGFLPREELLQAMTAALQAMHDQADPGGLTPPQVQVDKIPPRLILSTATLALSVAAIFAPPLVAAAAVGVAIASTPILLSATKSLVLERKLRVDALDATVIVMAQVYGRLFPAAFMVWVVDLSNVLLEASSRESRHKLAEIFGRQVRMTYLLVDGAEIEYNVADLGIGDRIVVRSGEQIPIDGAIVDGDAMVDQSALTGEYAPAEKIAGDKVFAMSVVLSGKIEIEVSETGENTNVAKLVKLIAQSAEHQVRMQSLAERFADAMVVPTLALGGVGYTIAGPNATMAIINADYGTGIRIAGPLGLLSSLSAAARNGILVKKGSVLESFSGTNAVIFDKTGTLTEEVPAVARIVLLDPGFDEREVLRYVAAAEQRFTHPIARAILRRAGELGLALPAVEDSGYQIGFGIHVRIEERTVHVGSRRYMEERSTPVSGEAQRVLDEIHADGGTAIFVSIDERLAGVIELQASPRAEARALVRTLREKWGIEEIHLLSGDHEAPTRALAERLGVANYAAEVLPQDKARYVSTLQERGLKVTMIGDGINDTVGLAQADYSISLRGAADAATDVADIVLMDGNLSKLDLLFDISDNLDRNVKRSFALVLIPNSFCIVGALLGFFGLGTSLVLNNVFNLVATGNGLRAQAPLRKRAESDPAIRID